MQVEHELQEASNDEFEAKLALISLFEKLAPSDIKKIPSITFPANMIIEDLDRFIKDKNDKIVHQEHARGIGDVCAWLRENPPISVENLFDVADDIAEHFGIE